MKLAFMSFLYPRASWRELIDHAVRLGYDGIEYRAEAGHGHGVEVDTPPAGVAEVRRAMADAGLETACLATSVRFCEEEPGARDANLERLQALIDLAARIGAPTLRLFGDPLPNEGGGARARNYEAQATYLVRASEHAAQAGIRLCIETHSNFRAYDAGEVLYRAGYPSALWVNWHLAHCIKHGEDVDEAYRHVKGRVGHVHFYLRDGHMDRQFDLLRAEGYGGFFSVEIMPKEGLRSDELLREHAAWFRGREGHNT